MTRAFAPYVDIEAQYAAPAGGDSLRLGGILDAMAELETSKLKFLGLRHAYGAGAPDKLDAEFPLTFRYVGPEGGQFGALASPNVLAHTGGLRQHLYWVEINLVVDFREGQDLILLSNATLHWSYALDLLYAKNARLGGRCHSIEVQRGRFGVIEWGDDAYFGWMFRALVDAQYLM